MSALAERPCKRTPRPVRIHPKTPFTCDTAVSIAAAAANEIMKTPNTNPDNTAAKNVRAAIASREILVPKAANAAIAS